MSTERRAALVAGIFFLITEVAAIAGLRLYGPVLDDPGYVLGGGADARVQMGALAEMILVVAMIGTAVTLYPVLRRRFEAAALGYVCARVMESVMVLVGAVAVLGVVTLREDVADGAAGSSAEQVAAGLVAVHDWTFLFGPGVIIGINSFLLAYMMLRTRLVPRPIAVLGLVGGSLISASAVASMFGLYELNSLAGLLSAGPVFAWEVTLAVWMIVKGFTPSATSGARAPRPAARPAAAGV